MDWEINELPLFGGLGPTPIRTPEKVSKAWEYPGPERLGGVPFLYMVAMMTRDQRPPVTYLGTHSHANNTTCGNI